MSRCGNCIHESCNSACTRTKAGDEVDCPMYVNEYPCCICVIYNFDEDGKLSKIRGGVI